MVASPEKTNAVLPELEPVVPLVELLPVLEAIEPPELRSIIQGTATCRPPPDELERPLVLAVSLLLPELDVFEDEPLPLWPPVTDRIAKSMRPEVGLMITSRTMPRLCPEELVT